jgi:hypothetical protein
MNILEKIRNLVRLHYVNVLEDIEFLEDLKLADINSFYNHNLAKFFLFFDKEYYSNIKT